MVDVKLKLIGIIAIMLASVIALGCVGEESPTKAPSTQTTQKATPIAIPISQPTPAELILKVGETATYSGLEVTVISAQKTKSYSYENSRNEVKVETAKPSKIFVLADLEIKNVGSDKVFPIGDFSVTDSEGYKYERSINYIFIYAGNDRLNSQELFPNQKSRGKLSFIIPENAQGLKLQYDFGRKWVSWLIE